MQEIKSDVLNYLDSGGLVAPAQGGGSLNGVLYTSIMMIILKDRDSLDTELKEHFQTQLGKCFKEPGLLTRTPDHNKDQEGPDDYAGIVAASNICDMPFANEVLKYGLKHFFVFNNDGVLKGGDWLGRQLQLVAHMFYCALGVCPPGLGLYWAAAIWHASNAKKEDQDAWVLSWLLVRCLPWYNVAGKLAAKRWYKKLYEHYPNGLRDLPYLNNSTDHPINRWWLK